MAEHARQLERELTAERERGRRVREELMDARRMFAAAVHACGGEIKILPTSLLPNLTLICTEDFDTQAIVFKARAESAPADVPTEGGG